MNPSILDLIRRNESKYKLLNSKYSSAYLSGAPWYVGESLEAFWYRQPKINYYDTQKKILSIVDLLERLK